MPTVSNLIAASKISRMSAKVVFRSKSFFVTAMYDHVPKRDLCAHFRISRFCAGAVKRNKIKRIIREFTRNQPDIFSDDIIFHVYKRHLNLQSDWQKYLYGVRYDLAKLAKYYKKLGESTQQGAVYNTPYHCTLSA